MKCAKCNHEYINVPLEWDDYVLFSEADVRPFMTESKTMCSKKCGCEWCSNVVMTVIGTEESLAKYEELRTKARQSQPEV